MLAQDVSRIDRSGNVGEDDHSRGDSFSDSMKGQHSVALVELCVDMHGAIYHRAVVAKHVGLLSDRDTKIAESEVKLDDLLDTRPRCNKLRTICCSLHGRLFLGEPVDRGLVEEMKDASDGSPRKQAMHEISIDIVGESHILAKRLGTVLRDLLLDVAIDRLSP